MPQKGLSQEFPTTECRISLKVFQNTESNLFCNWMNTHTMLGWKQHTVQRFWWISPCVVFSSTGSLRLVSYVLSEDKSKCPWYGCNIADVMGCYNHLFQGLDSPVQIRLIAPAGISATCGCLWVSSHGKLKVKCPWVQQRTTIKQINEICNILRIWLWQGIRSKCIWLHANHTASAGGGKFQSATPQTITVDLLVSSLHAPTHT